jgi:nitrate reductase assembly molybdenum cofactor insertion protein NarJ
MELEMNERIKELMVQADYPAPELALRAQKLAELIVRECADHAVTFTNNLQSLNDKEIRSHAHRVGDYIKDRLGFEE